MECTTTVELKFEKLTYKSQNPNPKMDSNENLLKKYEELTEWRKKAQAMKKLTDEPSTLLRKVHNLASSISMALKDVNTDCRQICNETNNIKYQFESADSLYIGRESVRPLIDLKNIATGVFAAVNESDPYNSVFTEKINFEPCYRKLEDMRKFTNSSKEFIRHLNSVADGITHLENENEKTIRSESTLSITGSDPSTSGCSLFANVATSSPL